MAKSRRSPQRLIDLPIEDELKESYLTYAMSVIVSRALPDVRDGLKPSQRRILVAMNDLNLSPGAGRRASAPSIVRRHQRQAVPPARRRASSTPPWSAWPKSGTMRHVLVDQAGQLRQHRRPPPRGRCGTPRRSMSSDRGSSCSQDLKLDTVDYHPHLRREVRPSRRSLPSQVPQPAGQRRQRHRRGHGDQHPAAQPRREVCRGIIALIDNPVDHDLGADGVHPRAPTSPPAGSSAAAAASYKGYHTGRSTRDSSGTHEHRRKGQDARGSSSTRCPYQQARDRGRSRSIAQPRLRRQESPASAGTFATRADLKEPVRLDPGAEARRRPRRGAQPALQVLSPIQDIDLR